MKKTKEANHKLKVSISFEHQKVDDVLCEVYLPERLTDPIDLIFIPSTKQFKQLDNMFEFSIYGEFKGFSGNTETILKAQTVYSKGRSNVHWGPDILEPQIQAYPYDLEITDIIHSESEATLEENNGGVFLLTPSIFLNPLLLIEPSYTGEIKVKRSRNLSFKLTSTLTLTFDTRFKYIDEENGDTTTFNELVAEFKFNEANFNIKQQLTHLDNFLMLTSFAGRQRCVCLGWEMWTNQKHTKYFRREMSIPETDVSHSIYDALIEPGIFEEFIAQVYTTFISFEPATQELISKAIWGTLGDKNKTVESEFISLYSSLESLVLLHNQNIDKEKNMPSGEWNRFSKEVKQFIKGSSILSDSKNNEKLKMVLEKISELNRPSFSTSFKEFCNFYKVEIDDLWPVVNRINGVCLSDLRNSLIHGDYFTPLEFDGLVSAKENLQWIVERSILTVLKWPVSKSFVSDIWLSRNSAIYKEWKSDRKIFDKQ